MCWKIHKLRLPSAHYTVTKWVKKREAGHIKVLIAGTDYVLNEPRVAAEFEHWITFPSRDHIKDAAMRRLSQQIHDSVILVARTRPVVPCPEQTPLPNRYMSKNMRSKIFSVYLRPWTMIAEEAIVEVPLLCDLDRPVASFDDKDGHHVVRDMRTAWKEYHRTRVPAAAQQQISNFMRIVCSQGRSFDEDDDEPRKKMGAVTIPLSSQKVGSILQRAMTSCLEETGTDGTPTSWQNTKQEFANKKVPEK